MKAARRKSAPARKKKAPVPAKAKRVRTKKAPSVRKISEQRRRRPIVRRLLLATALLAILVMVGGVVWMWQQGYVHQAWRGATATTILWVDRFSFAVGLELKHVKIEGHRVVSKEQILSASGLKSDQRYSLLRLSGDVLRERLEAIEFIRRVEVQKQFPDTVLLRITEREPIAIWQYKGAFRLLDSEGVVLNVPARGTFGRLPVMVGEDAVFHAKTLFDFLISEPVLFGKVRAMTLVHGRRWDIQLQGGVVVKLPETHPEQAWATLARLNQQYQLLEKQIKIIDLRLPEKLYILPLTEGR